MEQDLATIQESIAAAMPGDTVTIAAGVYDISDLVLPSGITLQASGDATIVGNLIVGGANATIKGFTFAGGTVDLGNSDGASVTDCVFNGGTASIKFDGASDAQIANNDFHNVSGNVID